MAKDSNNDDSSKRTLFNDNWNGSTQESDNCSSNSEPPGLEEDALSEDTTVADSLRTPPEFEDSKDITVTMSENAKPGDTTESPGGLKCSNQETTLEEKLAISPDHSLEIDKMSPEAPEAPEATRTDTQNGHSLDTPIVNSKKLPRRRRRRMRASHRTWDEELMPYGNMRGVLNDDDDETVRSDCSDNAEPNNDQVAVTEDWSESLFDDEDLDLMLDDSPNRIEWLRQKREKNEKNEHLDRLMSMVGLEQIKAHFLAVKDKVDAAKRWKEDVKSINLDLILHGNDGTGKRRIAWLYAEFLYSIGAVPRRSFERMSGYSIENETSEATVTFFDEADRIDQISDITNILEALKKRPDPTVLILSYRALKKEPIDAINHPEESRDRFPEPVVLKNYEEAEIAALLKRLVKKRPEFEDVHNRELILRLLAQKLARQCNNFPESFANVHTLQTELDELDIRRKKRHEKELLEWMKNNSPVEDVPLDEQKPKQVGFEVEDVLGPTPSDLRDNSAAWKELQSMVGLQGVKEEVDHIFNLASLNRQREIEGKKNLPIMLNRCFLGEPGVGKTTVAKIYGKILTDLGLLSKGEVIEKTPNDLIGPYIGHSERNTREVLDQAMGNLLIIDDAHMLYQGSRQGTNNSDSFRTGVIDTLVANISGSPSEDRCVLLCGYPDKMRAMFLNSNPGLQRRFPLESAIVFDNYSESELCQILEQKMASDGVSISEGGRKTALDVLRKMRTRPRFGNAGEVESLLSRASLRQVGRLRAANVYPVDMSDHPLEAVDFDPDFDRASRADQARDGLFKDFVGFEKITERFRRYQKMADGMRRYNIDPRPHIPWAFVFKGPPGTGKTSTARKVGKLFYDMGLISSGEVITCSVTDIVGEYLGQTGPKVISHFEMGLGKVLFIDEAYRLTGDKFHKEAVNEIVDAMTKPRYVGNMVVILAGYGDEMEKLMQTNPGLRSRFPTHITFPNLTPAHCLQLLRQTLARLQIMIPRDLDEPGSGTGKALDELFNQLARTKGWANGRDVETIAKSIIGDVFVRAGEEIDDSPLGSLHHRISPQSRDSALPDHQAIAFQSVFSEIAITLRTEGIKMQRDKEASMSHSSVSIRRKSCTPCFKGRRKCDLSYPVCKRCEKNNKACHYVYPPNQRAATNVELSKSKGHSSLAEKPSPGSSPDELVPIPDRSQSRTQHQLNWDGSLIKIRFPEPLGVPSIIGHLGELEPVIGLGNDAWIFEEMKACPTTYAQDTETFFIHKDLNQDSLAPGPLRAAWGICAGCITLNSRNRKFLFQAVDAELAKLLVPTPQGTLFEDLVTLQASVLYQMIRLIYGGIEQRKAAEQQEYVMRSLGLKLLQRLDSGDEMAQNTWETWLLRESVRRTVVATFKLYTLYWSFKLGTCTEVNAIAQLPISTKTGVWSSPQNFPQYPSKDETIPYRDFILFKSVAPRGSLETFEKMVVVSCRGVAEEDYFAIRDTL
ncbi:unnamed protein product [Clonostachys byssicola]|uniref:Zn(2)-C6 fungal-type domain-containing protein n=1 Tax=Clonostachys byssicola TaxID=160290 RepID=A0A9N9UCJ7_9HYPO|nr:unnamed protein product [Clonostachys byssicola]